MRDIENNKRSPLPFFLLLLIIVAGLAALVWVKFRKPEITKVPVSPNEYIIVVDDEPKSFPNELSYREHCILELNGEVEELIDGSLDCIYQKPVKDEPKSPKG